MLLNFCKNGLVYLILSKTLHLFISVSLPVEWIMKKLCKVVNAADSFFSSVGSREKWNIWWRIARWLILAALKFDGSNASRFWGSLTSDSRLINQQQVRLIYSLSSSKPNSTPIQKWSKGKALPLGQVLDGFSKTVSNLQQMGKIMQFFFYYLP